MVLASRGRSKRSDPQYGLGAQASLPALPQEQGETELMVARQAAGRMPALPAVFDQGSRDHSAVSFP
jgi:hypothetical protein